MSRAIVAYDEHRRWQLEMIHIADKFSRVFKEFSRAHWASVWVLLLHHTLWDNWSALEPERETLMFPMMKDIRFPIGLQLTQWASKAVRFWVKFHFHFHPWNSENCFRNYSRDKLPNKGENRSAILIVFIAKNWLPICFSPSSLFLAWKTASISQFSVWDRRSCVDSTFKFDDERQNSSTMNNFQISLYYLNHPYKFSTIETVRAPEYP